MKVRFVEKIPQIVRLKSVAVGSVGTLTAWPRGLKHRFYGDVLSPSRDLRSTPILTRHVVASLIKALYDDYLCLVASNKQKIQW